MLTFDEAVAIGKAMIDRGEVDPEGDCNCMFETLEDLANWLVENS